MPHRPNRRALLLLLALAGLIAAACGPAPARLTATLPPAAPDLPSTAATQTPTHAATVTLTEAAAPEVQTAALLPTPTLAPGEACLECHTNADLLRQLAVEEDVPAAPSEGSG